MCTIWTHQLLKSFPQQGELSELHSECYSEELWSLMMKLWGWAQDNVSNLDIMAGIIGVQTKMQTFSFFYGLQLAIVVFSIQITSALAYRDQSYVQLMLKRMPSFLSLFFEVHSRQGFKPPLDQGHSSCCEVGHFHIAIRVF